MDLPPDPFIPDDPRFREAPMAKYMLEAGQLMTGFVNVASLSSLVENLHAADRRDVELVAMLALATDVREAFTTMAEEGSLTAEEADARYVDWLIGPASDGTLDDL